MARKLTRKSNRDKQQPDTASRTGVRTAKSVASALLRAALAVSLDGYIADKRGEVEWLNAYFSPEMDFAAFMASIGATVMGRATFDVAMKLGMPPGASEQKSIVLTNRPLAVAPRGFEPFAGDLGQLVERLRGDLAGTGKDIWLMGGGVAINSFAAAGLVDRLELGVIPVLLGEGIPLFPPHSRGLQALSLIHTRALKNGVVELWYERPADIEATIEP